MTKDRKTRLDRLGLVEQLIGVVILLASVVVPNPILHQTGPVLILTFSVGVLLGLALVYVGTENRITADRLLGGGKKE
jgi:hypothetical protein